MSVADDFVMSSHFCPGPTSGAPLPRRSEPRQQSPHQQNPQQQSRNGAPKRPARCHRIAEVRQQQGVSVRSAARRMGVSMEQVRREERPDCDLSLSDLARWQKALEVPLVDLLVDNNAPLSEPVLKRAKWLRLMKTVKALAELKASPAVSRMAEMLEQQVLEIMPELQDVGAWHSVGQRRTQDEMGRIVEDIVPTTFARDGLH
jgi:transcriptional regulator with XRE-family HTH domain